MTRLHLLDAEPVSSLGDRTGSTAFHALEPVLEIARGWAGPRRLALLLSGSHASGEAVWATVDGRRVSLSDVDLYTVLPDRAARVEAEARARAGRVALAPRLLARGLAAPLEVGFLTPADLDRLPARPATLELSRRGRLLEGDPAWLQRVPVWKPKDVSREEILLLLENRAFGLLAARTGPPDDPLAVLKRRHATLKGALDLATVLALAAGELPESAGERVEWARARWPRIGRELEEPPWEDALAWRRGCAAPLEPAAARREWLRTARAWVAVWRSVVGGGDEREAARLALGSGRRASLKRRVRLALHSPSRSGRGPGLLERLPFWRGTPQHRLNASAAVVLAALAGAPEAVKWPEACTPDSRRALERLGVLRGPRGLADAPARLVRLWEDWVLDGQRHEAGA